MILYSHHLSAMLGFRGSDHAICKNYTITSPITSNKKHAEVSSWNQRQAPANHREAKIRSAKAKWNKGCT